MDDAGTPGLQAVPGMGSESAERCDLFGLITRRSRVQITPPLPNSGNDESANRNRGIEAPLGTAPLLGPVDRQRVTAGDDVGWFSGFEEPDLFAEYADCVAAPGVPLALSPAAIFEDLPGEEWRTVAEFTAYEVSNLGRLRSCRGAFARLMKPSLDGRGYYVVGLFVDAAKKKTRTVHSVVAAAFHGPRPVGLVIDHVDADKTNNRDTNLEYVTQEENARRAGRLGLNGFQHRRCGDCGELGHTVRMCRRARRAA